MKNLIKVSEVKLVYKTRYNINERPHIKVSKDAYDVLLNEWDMDIIEHRESSKMLMMNRANRVLGVGPIAEGGITGTVMDTKIIMQYALKANACSIIICHNHPSGRIMPGETDDQLTNNLKEAGKILGIELLDHLIISKIDYYSYADEGRL